MKKLTVGLVFLFLISFALAEAGQIHMIYANGSVNVSENSKIFIPFF